MQITDETVLRKLADYSLIQNVLGARHNEHFLSYILDPYNNELYNNLKDIIMSNPDFKTLSTYQNESQSDFILNIMKFGLITIIDNDTEFDTYSYYNKELWAHNINSGWVKVKSVSKEISNLLSSIGYIFKSSQNKDKAYIPNKLLKLRGWTFFGSDLITDNWTVSRNTKSIMEQFDEFQVLFQNVSKTLPDEVELVLNTINMKDVNWDVRYKLLLNVTNPNILPETPISYNLIAGFQFVQWIILKEKLYEK